jgi:hypothetical protein
MAIDDFLGVNGIFARFQNAELASGIVAIDRSPIPPARASGEMRKKGTAVLTILMESVCAFSLGLKTVRLKANTNKVCSVPFIQ